MTRAWPLRGLRAPSPEVALALVLAPALGALLAIAPLWALVAAAACAGAAALRPLGISPPAGAVGLVAIGHLVSGQLYVVGALPGGFAVVLDVMTVALFLGLAVRARPRARATHVLAVAFVGVSALEALNPMIGSLHFGLYGVRLLALPLLLMLAVKEADLSPREVRFLLGLMAIGWSVSVAVAARQWLTSFSGAELAWIQRLGSTYLVGDEIRLMGAAQSNQDFGFFAAIAFPVVSVLALGARTPRHRALLGALAVASLAVLFGSLVRSSLLGGVVGAVAAAAAAGISMRDRKRLLALGAALVVVVWAAATVLPAALLPAGKAQTLQRRVGSIFSPQGDHAVNARRTGTWPRALAAIEAHPLGAGAGAAGPLSQAHPAESPLGALAPDNGYLLVAVQLGIPGLLLFAALLGQMGRDLRRGARAGSRLAAAGFGALAALSVAMLLGGYWSLLAPASLFAIVVGLGLREGHERQVAAAESRPA